VNDAVLVAVAQRLEREEVLGRRPRKSLPAAAAEAACTTQSLRPATDPIPEPTISTGWLSSYSHGILTVLEYSSQEAPKVSDSSASSVRANTLDPM
jgi:hypothetical protein